MNLLSFVQRITHGTILWFCQNVTQHIDSTRLKPHNLSFETVNFIDKSGLLTVLSHSYFHTLPEEAAVLFELKSSYQDPNVAAYQQLQHGSNQRMSMGMLDRQGSNESDNER